MGFKPGFEHDYVVANIAYILRNAHLRGKNADQVQSDFDERMRYLGRHTVNLSPYFETDIARGVFRREARDQRSGIVAKEFRDLSRVDWYSFSTK